MTDRTCSRCGAETFASFTTYFAQVAPVTTGKDPESWGSPLRTRRGGLCRKCAKAIQSYIEEDGALGVAFSYSEMVAIIVRIQKDPEFAERWQRICETAARQAQQGGENADSRKGPETLG